MELLYRLYYTFYKKTVKENRAGMRRNPAWIYALTQTCCCFVIPILVGVAAVNKHVFNKDFSQIGIFILSILVVGATIATIYSLIFNYYGVSKSNGLTEMSQYAQSKTNDRRYYLIAIVMIGVPIAFVVLSRLFFR